MHAVSVNAIKDPLVMLSRYDLWDTSLDDIRLDEQSFAPEAKDATSSCEGDEDGFDCLGVSGSRNHVRKRWDCSFPVDSCG